MTEVFRSGDHEQVVFCRDEPSGLRAIIAIHSTALGPALGGTRFHPYPSEEAALADVLHLSCAMSYKNALAGLDHGGGKAVILGDPTRDKTEALLRAYGRFVQSLGGRYITACDVGTYVEDMDVVAKESEFVTGRSLSHGGAGDSSILTAFGVFQGMRAAAQQVWGTPTLSGRRVGVAGVGKVGRLLVDHLLADGASVIVAPSTEALVREPIDVYAPCALGSALDDPTVTALRAKVVCGGANNQLEHPGIEKLLEERGILYAPDYVVNSGGVIQVADEIEGFDFHRAKARVAKVFDTTREIFELAERDGVPPAVAADHLAERRMADVGRLRKILVDGRAALRR